MAGTNLYDDPGTGITTCTPSTTFNPPGCFENRACWARGNGTHLEFFGGFEHIDLSSSFNDLWDYNITNNQWTLMTGSVVGNQVGSYGTYQVSSGTNMPPSRAGSSSWMRNDTLWVFGGCNPYLNNYNDLWRFVPDTTCPEITIIQPVVAGFTNTPDTGCAPLTVTFTNTSTGGSTSV